jgi:phage terminase large subunit
MTTTVRFEARGAVRDLFLSRDPSIVLSGAAGTGKSHGALMLTHLDALRYPGSRHLLLRKTLASLTASTLVTWNKAIIPEAKSAGLVRFFGGNSQEPPAFKYANGSAVVVGGLDKATKLLSTEYDTAFIDEAIEVTDEDLDTLETRLRNGVMPYQQLRMCTNPGAPTHHLKQRCDEGRCRMAYSVHEDNPRMYTSGGEWTEYGQTYLARLDSLKGVRYDRMRRGLWVAAEGLIYDGWNDRLHLVDRFDPPADWWRFWSIDWGFSNPAVVQWWAVDPDGRAWLYREIYHTGKTVPELAKMVLRQVTKDGTRDGEWLEPRPRAILADHDAGDRALFTRETGLQTRRADKRVKIGIDTVKERLKTAGDGRPRVMVMRDARCHRPDPELAGAKKPTCTADEFTSYVWENKGGEQQETPLKEHDHGMDATRYACVYLDPPRSGKSKLHLPVGSLR